MMKKIGMLIGIASIVVFAACNNTKEESSSDNDTIIQEVEVPVETEQTTTRTTTTTTKTNDDGTTIEVDQNGVILGNKNGGDETNVKITTDSTKLKIRRK